MTRHRVGLAVFARTPGLSPSKTRLAAELGVEAAATFATLSLAAVEAVVRRAARELPELVPVWAVAEPAGVGHPRFRALPTLWQGEGELGTRMAAVYEALRAEHGAAMLVGSDLPLLTPGLLLQACRHLAAAATPFVMGPARDGGFYLFGGRGPVPRSVWESVPYGAPDTAARFRAAVGALGPVAELPALPDVDVAADLARVLSEAPRGLLAEQEAVLAWMGGILGRPPTPAGHRAEPRD